MILDLIILLTLIALGILLVILEVFFLPGITVAGIGGLLFLGGACYYAFYQLGTIWGMLTISIALIACIWAIIYFMRSRTLDKMSLNTDIDSRIPTIPKQIKVGDRGITLSRLNPIGKVIIGEWEIEGKSQEDFIEEETPIEVVHIGTTNVVVKRES